MICAALGAANCNGWEISWSSKDDSHYSVLICEDGRWKSSWDGSKIPELNEAVDVKIFFVNNRKDLFEKWENIRSIRKVVTGAIELERKEKRIGSSLEAKPIVFVSNEDYIELLRNIDLPEIFITSQAELRSEEGPKNAFTLDDISDVSVICEIAEGNKCNRSWKILPEVGTDNDYPDLSLRDANVMREINVKGH